MEFRSTAADPNAFCLRDPGDFFKPESMPASTAVWSPPASYPRWGHLKMEIVVETGTVVMDAFAQHMTLYSRGCARNPSWVGFGPDPNQAMLEEFVASIRDQRDPCVSWRDGYPALRVALAGVGTGPNR